MHAFPLLKLVAAALGMAAVLLAGCSGKAQSSPPSAAGSAPRETSAGGAPVAVTTAAARRQDFAIVLQAVGAVAPISSVEIKPQATSVITRVHVKEGQFVRAGELLFTLDSRTDEANVEKMRAQVARDEAALADAKRQLARSRELLAQNFVSQGAVDTNLATVAAQTAAVTSAAVRRMFVMPIGRRHAATGSRPSAGRLSGHGRHA